MTLTKVVIGFAAALISLGVSAESQTYRYDADGRLIGVDYGAGEKVDYPVDGIGNRTDAVKHPPPPGTIAFSNSAFVVAEGVPSISLSVVRTGSVALAATVYCSTSPGTATAGSDYTTVTNQALSWAANDGNPKNCVVTIKNDTLFEANETFTVSLTNASGATIINPQSATVTINDDETKAVIAFVSPGYVKREDAGPSGATLFVKRTAGMVGTVTVHYATSNGSAKDGSDYIATSGTLTWADNDSGNKSISVEVIDDYVAESDEYFRVTLSAPTGNAVVGTPSYSDVVILCNDGYQCQ